MNLKLFVYIILVMFIILLIFSLLINFKIIGHYFFFELIFIVLDKNHHHNIHQIFTYF